MVSVATDGARSRGGAHKGFPTLLQNIKNCSCSSASCTNKHCVCKHSRQSRVEATAVWLCTLPEEVDSAYPDLLLRNKVRWLSGGGGAETVLSVRGTSESFPRLRLILPVSQQDPSWLEELDFTVDMTRFKDP